MSTFENRLDKLRAKYGDAHADLLSAPIGPSIRSTRKPPLKTARLFPRYPEALARTIEITERCRFSLDDLAYQYPLERQFLELTAQQALERLTWEGTKVRYPEGLPVQRSRTS